MTDLRQESLGGEKKKKTIKNKMSALREST